jgi:hypothetical protein
LLSGVAARLPDANEFDLNHRLHYKKSNKSSNKEHYGSNSRFQKGREKKSQEEKLRRDIQDSVNRCGAADREENRELFNAGVARADGKE